MCAHFAWLLRPRDRSCAETSLAQDRDGLVARTNRVPPRSTQRRRRSFPRNSLCRPPGRRQTLAPPQPAESWNDVREAKAFGAYCAAAKSTDGPRSEAEDCLFINVWRPSDVSADARLPVYVYIHGGGLINGSSNKADMTEIVEETGVIGVSFNYRLGALGFFSHPDVTKDSGDFGLMDQQAALRWVHENIAAFGGDPTRVTVGGESAGGYSVCAHLAAPGSAGLFAQAMMQSGYVLQHSAGSSAKERRRDRRRGWVQRAGRVRVPARRSGGQAHRRALSTFWRSRFPPTEPVSFRLRLARRSQTDRSYAWRW